MVALGVGKNMVRAIRFWVQAMGVAETSRGCPYTATEFGHAVFAENGFDPFLEDIRTLWLLHWQLVSHTEEPLFAWDFMLNRWHHPDISRSRVLEAFTREARRLGRELSPVTLGQHFDTFLHTYVPTKSPKGEILEDNLDCPLVELGLIQDIGERGTSDRGRRERIYAFRREEKPEITPEVFVHCLGDFWRKRRATEQTISFQDVAAAHGSPGQIFKLPEAGIRDRLTSIDADSNGAFSYRESAALQQVTTRNGPEASPLSAIYRSEMVYA